MSPESLLSKWGSRCESLEPRLFFSAARTTDYFPLDPGLSWQYRCVDGEEKFLGETRIRDKKSKLDGVKTSVMDTGDGKTYYSFADGVLRKHKETWIDDEDGGTSTSRFDQPYDLVPARLRVGSTFHNEGAWHGKTAEGMTWAGRVEHDLTVVKREEVTVPAGTFSALRIRIEQSETMDSGQTGWTALMEQVNTIWLVKDIGMVKAKLVEHEEFYFQGRLDSEEDMESTQRLRKCDHMPTGASDCRVFAQDRKDEKLDAPDEQLVSLEQLVSGDVD